MNSPQTRTARLIAALLACFAAAAVAQALHQQPTPATVTAANSVAALPWTGSGDTSVPSAATVLPPCPSWPWTSRHPRSDCANRLLPLSACTATEVRSHGLGSYHAEAP